MALFDIFRSKKVVETPQEDRSFNVGLGFNTISTYQTTQSMRLSAVYAATNMISNSCALLPIKIVRYTGDRKEEIKHSLYDVLNLHPDGKHNHFNWMKLLIESVILKGNGYAYIRRDDKLNVVSLELINPDYVTPMPQSDGTVKYLVAGMSTAVDAINMIHLFQHVDQTFNGISTIKFADMALRASYDAEEHSDNFFKSGAGLMGILKAQSPLTADQKKQIAESWEKSITHTKGGGVAILPQGLDFQSIAISPEDSQLLETRQYNVVEIARFFNISPVKLFDLTHVSYSTLEQTSLSYLQDTILPFTQLMEDEFNKKLFKPSQVGNIGVDFDYSVLITTDKKSEAEYYRTLITNGVISINEARNKLGLTPVEGDEYDAHFLQLSYGTVKNINDGVYVKNNPQDATGEIKVDNQAKENNKEEKTEE